MHLSHPHSSGRKQDVNNTEDAARGSLRHPPLHSHCLRLKGKAKATRVTPHDQNVDLYGKRGVNHIPWSMGFIMISLGKSLLLLYLLAHTSSDFLFPVSLPISSQLPVFGSML